MEKVIISQCPVTHCMRKIGGKWKPTILYLIKNNINRFGKMLKLVPGLSKQSLTQQLRDLETDGLILRKIYNVVPPHVEYFMTDYGLGIFKIIEQMEEWGLADMKAE